MAKQSLSRQTSYAIFTEKNEEEIQQKPFANHTGNMQNRRSLPQQGLFGEKNWDQGIQFLGEFRGNGTALERLHDFCVHPVS